MPSRSRSHPVVTITGVVYALIGLALAGGGAWLAALGGSLFYLIAGLGILVTGCLLIAGRRSALWVYAAVLIGTLIWAVAEVGFDWWPLAARGDIIFPLGPLAADALDHPQSRPRTRRRSARAIDAAALGRRGRGRRRCSRSVSPPTITTIDGTIADGRGRPRRRMRPAQPDEDWRAYGRTQFGQRYSPLTQITPDNVKNLKVAWTFRTGDLPGKNDPGETTFEVTPIKVARHALSLLAAPAPVRARRQDRQAALVLRSASEGQPDLPASDLPRRLLPRDRGGRRRQPRRVRRPPIARADLPAGQ